MRTSLKTMFAMILGCVILANTNNAKAMESDDGYTTVSAIKGIGKIVISGNVKVTLIQDAVERISVYGKDIEINKVVQQDGNTLKISSFRKTPLAIVVFVNNLNEISASNKASVKTRGKFKLLNLSVKLQGQAAADINARVVNLYTAVVERADLKLCGAAESHTIVMSSLGNLNMDQFVANDTVISTGDSRKYVAM